MILNDSSWRSLWCSLCWRCIGIYLEHWLLLGGSEHWRCRSAHLQLISIALSVSSHWMYIWCNGVLIWVGWMHLRMCEDIKDDLSGLGVQNHIWKQGRSFEFKRIWLKWFEDAKAHLRGRLVIWIQVDITWVVWERDLSFEFKYLTWVVWACKGMFESKGLIWVEAGMIWVDWNERANFKRPNLRAKSPYLKCTRAHFKNKRTN